MINKVFPILKPINTLFVAVTYFLGIGIAHYLGFPQRWDVLWNGLFLLIAFQTGCIFLGKYFELYFFPNLYSRDEKSHLIQNHKEQNIRILYLLIGVAFLSICLIPIFSLMSTSGLRIMSLAIIVFTLFIIGIVELFPSQVSSGGLMEFLQAFYFANLIPLIAFILQSNLVHRLLIFLTFPLLFLFFSYFIVSSLPNIGKNIRIKDCSLISRIGPILSLRIHNIFVLLAYLTLLSGSLFEVPWKLIWPVLITLPIGLIQIWQVNQILMGHKPSFTPLIFSAFTTTGFAPYFMMLSLLIN